MVDKVNSSYICNYVSNWSVFQKFQTIFVFQKINQVLDFKTRLLNNLEHKNREQNSQVLGIGDSSTAGSSINTTTEFPVS